MSTPNPPPPPPPPAPPSPPNPAAARLKHNISLSLLIACPILIALPPRKLDWYTFGLMLAGGASARHLVMERRGGVWEGRVEGKEEGVSEEIKGVVWDVLSQSGKSGGDGAGKGEGEERK